MYCRNWLLTRVERNSDTSFPLLWSTAWQHPVLPSSTRGFLLLNKSLIILSEKFSFQNYWGDLERPLILVSNTWIILQLCIFRRAGALLNLSSSGIVHLDEMNFLPKFLKRAWTLSSIMDMNVTSHTVSSAFLPAIQTCWGYWKCAAGLGNAGSSVWLGSSLANLAKISLAAWVFPLYFLSFHLH